MQTAERGQGVFGGLRAIRGTMTWRVIVMVSLCYLLNMMDRNIVSVAAPSIQKEFGLSNTQLGLAFSVFGFAYLLQAPVGWLCDKWGARLGLAVFGSIWSGATIACGLTSSLGGLVGARAVLGLGEAAPFPAMTRVIADWTPPTSRSFVQGLTHSFVSIGTTLTPPLVAWAMGVVGWRGAFLLLGAASAVWVVVWAAWFRDDPRQCKSVTAEELAQLVVTRKPDARAPWGRLIPAMLPPAIVYMCISATFWTFWTWLPTYFAKSYHLVLKDSAIFTFGVLFAGVGGDISGGWLSDVILRRTGSLRMARGALVAVALVAAAASIGPVLVLRDVNLAALALAGGYFFIRMSVSPTWAVCTDIAPAWAGFAGGMLNTGSAISSICAPLAFGFIADLTGNYSIPFSASLVLLLVGAAMCATMRPDRRVD
ncbi:MAG TPA: MFS transporter [Rhodopila sp.]|nr:MFS transporter [Rhodopila sp.]